MADCGYTTSSTGGRVLHSVATDIQQLRTDLFNYLKAFNPTTYNNISAGSAGDLASGTVTYTTASATTGSFTYTQQSCIEEEIFDYSQAGAIWGFAFTFTVGLWFVAKNAGAVISAIRRF